MEAKQTNKQHEEERRRIYLIWRFWWKKSEANQEVQPKEKESDSPKDDEGSNEKSGEVNIENSGNWTKDIP